MAGNTVPVGKRTLGNSRRIGRFLPEPRLTADSENGQDNRHTTSQFSQHKGLLLIGAVNESSRRAATPT
jgi:hypothetical protein